MNKPSNNFQGVSADIKKALGLDNLINKVEI